MESCLIDETVPYDSTSMIGAILGRAVRRRQKRAMASVVRDLNKA